MSVERLLEIMAALRDPESGCPWDRRQDFSSIASYTLEEAYEVIDSIAREDYDELKDELGDLLFQVVFHSQMASERGYFDFRDVVAAICGKMVRRHPHVFEKQVQGADSDETSIKQFWEAEKARERADKEQQGVLDGVARALPALKRAQKLQKRAAGVGFDWPGAEGVVEKIHEELGELERAGGDRAAVAEELGDLLFSCVNLARHLGVDAEDCLLSANRKFETRFRALEAELDRRGHRPEECGLEELDALWDEVKRGLRG